MINYNQYLFAELLKSYSEYFGNMEYDRFFDLIPSMYDQFYMTERKTNSSL